MSDKRAVFYTLTALLIFMVGYLGFVSSVNMRHERENIDIDVKRFERINNFVDDISGYHFSNTLRQTIKLAMVNVSAQMCDGTGIVIDDLDSDLRSAVVNGSIDGIPVLKEDQNFSKIIGSYHSMAYLSDYSFFWSIDEINITHHDAKNLKVSFIGEYKLDAMEYVFKSYLNESFLLSLNSFKTSKGVVRPTWVANMTDPACFLSTISAGYSCEGISGIAPH